MSEPFQPARPLPPAWPDLAEYAQSLETRIAELEKRPCKNVVVTTEGTAYCRLAEDEAKNLRWVRAEMSKKADEIVKKTSKTIAVLTIQNERLSEECDTTREKFVRAVVALGELEVAAGIRETPRRGDQYSEANVAERFAAVAVRLREARADAARLRDALEEAVLQIEYLHGRFVSTGSGNAVLEKCRAALTASESDAPAAQECAECARLHKALTAAREALEVAYMKGRPPQVDELDAAIHALAISEGLEPREDAPAPITSASVWLAEQKSEADNAD